MQRETFLEQFKRRSKMKRYRRQCLFDLGSGFVCAVVVVTFGWLLLQWFHDTGAELLGFGLAVMP